MTEIEDHCWKAAATPYGPTLHRKALRKPCGRSLIYIYYLFLNLGSFSTPTITALICPVPKLDSTLEILFLPAGAVFLPVHSSQSA